MQMKSVVFQHNLGPNNIQYGFVDDMTIKCISDFELNEEDLTAIERLLWIDTNRGKRWAPEIELDEFGKIITTWSFLEPSDCDWS